VRHSTSEKIGMGLLIAVAFIAIFALIVGFNFAIAYFLVYKTAVHLGMARGNAFGLAVIYYAISSLATSTGLRNARS
jgi:hypothetical protein